MADLLELLQHAVLAALDDQAGFVISGGLDSSTVRCVAADLGAGNLPTFTGYYADGPQYDEREWAHLVASPEHHDVEIRPQDFVDHFDHMIQAVRPPFMGPGTFGQYMVGRHIAQHTDVKVVISGEGADELFGGYARQMIVAGLKPPDGYENYMLPDHYAAMSIWQSLDYEFQRLPLLLAVDEQCMAAHGLEARAPFTDPAVQQFALALPAGDRVGKTYLRNAVRGLVPDAIIDRTDKRGFPSPLVAWAQQEPVRSFVHDRLGYTPDPGKPWDRAWWLELCERCHVPLAEAA